MDLLITLHEQLNTALATAVEARQGGLDDNYYQQIVAGLQGAIAPVAAKIGALALAPRDKNDLRVALGLPTK